MKVLPCMFCITFGLSIGIEGAFFGEVISSGMANSLKCMGKIPDSTF